MSITGDSNIMVSAISLPEFSKDKSKILINPDLKPTAIVESWCEDVSFNARSLFVVNSVIWSMVSAFQMKIF